MRLAPRTHLRWGANLHSLRFFYDRTMMPTPDLQLLREPKWRAEDLGAPLPDSAHANSVCLPHWRDITDYEEKNPRVMERLRAGYPRFVVPAQCADFFAVCGRRFAGPDERCHAYPSERSADRCADYIKRWSGQTARVVAWPDRRVFVVCFPAAVEAAALKYWRHTGEGISSRHAESLIAGRMEVDSAEARARVMERLSGLLHIPASHLYLFKSGMAGLFTLHRMATQARPEGACVQFGFPYVDTLKIQQEFGYRSTFFPLGAAADIKLFGRLAALDQLAAVFCEFPSNPLLSSPDLAALSRICRAQRIPLIVDDTVSSCVNVDLRAAADVIVTSLTKYFTGRGDVMAGLVAINPGNPPAGEITPPFRAAKENTTPGGNLVLLDHYSQDFPERMAKINRTAERITDWLAARPDVATVYYPKHQQRELYDAFKRPDGGYSGLFSVLLRNAATRTEPFYNALQICKGPNLGTTFSLCCPFTLLAHYDELEWAERCGVSRYLLRFSIGLEEPDDLIARLEHAFRKSEAG